MNTSSTRILLIQIFSVLFVVSCGSKSLGTFKGMVDGLLPQKVGSYTKETQVGRFTSEIPNAEGFIEYKVVGYVASKDNWVLLMAANFNSRENATKALTAVKAKAFKLDSNNVKASGEKRKGTSSVGERFEGVSKSLFGPQYLIYWTNGSVLFNA